MSHLKSFGLAIFTAVCSIGVTTGSAQAQCQGFSGDVCATGWNGASVINLGNPSGGSYATGYSINNAGQVVGYIGLSPTEWSGASVISLGGIGQARSINDAGVVVGVTGTTGVPYATEWSAGKLIYLGQGYADHINDMGQVVGMDGDGHATEWSGGNVISLPSLPGSSGESEAQSINDAGQAVGYDFVNGVLYATEWTNGGVINLGPGIAFGINDAGLVVGTSGGYGVEWSGGTLIELTRLPNTLSSQPFSVNDAGQVVGTSEAGGEFATEWSGGNVINLGGLPGSVASQGVGINDIGEVVGNSQFLPPPPLTVPEPSTWAMMLLGFAGLALAGYRRSARVLGQNARLPKGGR